MNPERLENAGSTFMSPYCVVEKGMSLLIGTPAAGLVPNQTASSVLREP